MGRYTFTMNPLPSYTVPVRSQSNSIYASPSYCFKIHFNIILHLHKHKKEENQCKPIRNPAHPFWPQTELRNCGRFESSPSWRETKKVLIILGTTCNKNEPQDAQTMLNYKPNWRGRLWRSLKRLLDEPEIRVSRPNSWRMLITLTAVVNSTDWTQCTECTWIRTMLSYIICDVIWVVYDKVMFAVEGRHSVFWTLPNTPAFFYCFSEIFRMLHR